MINEVTIDKSWDRVWKNYEGLNAFGRFMMKNKEKVFEKIIPIYIPKNYSVIDIGCGAGHTLNIFRKIGYKNSIGIDPSKHSIELCEKINFIKNKDVFISDAKKWKGQKDVVMSHGLLEHFDYLIMKDLIKQFVRISKHFIILTQPNPNALISKLAQKTEWERERPYTEENYIKLFETMGCQLVHKSKINLNEFYFLIFEKNNIKN
jgi:SAM-dependent methyltransferase